MTQRTNPATKLQVKVITGTNSQGKDTIATRSFTMNPELADETFRLVRKAFDAGLDVRREGAAALDLCTVAAGRAGLYFEMQISLWDYAAGALIVEEAGGRCCTLSGESLPADGRRTSVLAGSRDAAEEFLADMKG